MRARVFVTLKPSVFDPQGTTVAEALHTLGYAAVRTSGRANTSSWTSKPERRMRRVALPPRPQTGCWRIR